jgi:hypothetical protein
MAMHGRTPLRRNWPRGVALPALFAVSFAATLWVRLWVVARARSDASPVVAVAASPQASFAPFADRPAQSEVVDTAPQVEGSTPDVQVAEPPSPSAHVLPPGASYWPPD